MHTDRLGRPLEVGDTVHLIDRGRSSCYLVRATILRLTSAFILTDKGRKSPNNCLYLDDQEQANIDKYPEHYI